MCIVDVCRVCSCIATVQLCNSATRTAYHGWERTRFLLVYYIQWRWVQKLSENWDASKMECTAYTEVFHSISICVFVLRIYCCVWISITWCEIAPLTLICMSLLQWNARAQVPSFVFWYCYLHIKLACAECWSSDQLV